MAFFRRNSLGPLLVAMLLAALLGFGLARGLHATDDMRSQLDLFSQVLYLVQNNYVEVPDNEKLIKGAIDGMLKTLDPHSVYLPAQRAQKMDCGTGASWFFRFKSMRSRPVTSASVPREAEPWTLRSSRPCEQHAPTWARRFRGSNRIIRPPKVW